STWLGRIVINQAITRRRAMTRRPESSLDTYLEQRATGRHEAALASQAEPGPESALLRQEMQTVLRAAIDEMPERYRAAVMVGHFAGASIAEIADHVGITPNAAKLRLMRAHRTLRRLLAARGIDEPGRAPR